MTEHRFVDKRFADKRLVKGFEGGAIYAAEQDGKAYVIMDESMLGGLLTPGEDDALLPALVRALEFDTVAARDAYLRERDWLPRPRRRPRGVH